MVSEDNEPALTRSQTQRPQTQKTVTHSCDQLRNCSCSGCFSNINLHLTQSCYEITADDRH
jgi:hypothetical protein